MTGGLAADAGLHLDLPAPRMLNYGEQNNTHSYLRNLDAAAGVELSAILPVRPPMDANALEMWRGIHSFHTNTEQE